MKALAFLKRLLRRWPPAYRTALYLYPFLTAILSIFRLRRGSFDHLKSSWSLASRAPNVAGRPMNFTVEPTNICNLKCPVCETGCGELGRQDAHMSLESFKAIIDKIGEHTNTLMFYFMGEPFLNKQAYAMIRYAKDVGIPWVTTCTNGDAVNPEKLLKSGIDEISFQIGGVTQGTHSVYRVNSRLERVLGNLRETLELRRQRNVKVRVVCGFILMKHNEHELPEFHKLMAELGVDEANVIDPCVRTVEQGHQFLPSDSTHWYYDVASFKNGLLRPRVRPKNACPWLWYSLVVQVNGDVVPCCRDPRGEFVVGNLLTQSLDEIWNGKPLVEFRRRVLSDQASVSICRLCSGYPASAIK